MNTQNLDYDACWFEIRAGGKKLITRNRDKFLRNSTALSQLQEVVLYRIDRTSLGFARSRLPGVLQ